MESRLDQKLDQAPPKRSTTLPCDRDLLAFELVNGSGTLHKPPRSVRCPGCAQRTGTDGPVLCVLFTNVRGALVLSYFHSKGNKNGVASGRWLLSSLSKGSKTRLVCDNGHACDINL